ncbi:hypothetical protein OCUBac02_34410 [Bosea sp. ANAM02]|nr:hypothetical protein OCUBac02_34410 [Bosea sp. ANAM02]
MIVGVALVAMRGAMAVTMIVVTMAVIVVIMAAAAALAMGMLVVMLVLVAMRVIMAMVRVIMSVAVIMAMLVMVVPAAAIVAMGVVMDLRLRLERSLDHRHRTALPAYQFAERRIVGDIEGIGRHFGRDVMAAEMPGEAYEPQRVLGADFQQAFRRGLDPNQRAVFQLQRVAVVQHRRPVERDREFQPTRRADADAVDRAVAVAKRQRIDDALGLDGGLAENGGGAKHRCDPMAWGSGVTRPDRSLVAQTGGRATKPGCHRGLSAAAP